FVELGAATLAFSQVILHFQHGGRIAVEMLCELFVAQMLAHHALPITSGPSALRNLRTARLIPCLAEPSLNLSAPLISAIEQPSKCRITNAVRSMAVSDFIA